jgi:hypothetical protein
MITRLNIDIEEIGKSGYTIPEFFAILSLYYGHLITNETIKKATDDGYIDFKGVDFDGLPVNPKVNHNGFEMLDEVLVASEIQEKVRTKGKVEDRFIVLADKLRDLYPSGKKPGTNYQWKDSTAIIAKKLKALIASTGAKFTDEEAVEATERYVKSFNGNYQYMQLLKYFISKRVAIDGTIEENSQLLSYIQNKEEDTADSSNNWLNELV